MFLSNVPLVQQVCQALISHLSKYLLDTPLSHHAALNPLPRNQNLLPLPPSALAGPLTSLTREHPRLGQPLRNVSPLAQDFHFAVLVRPAGMGLLQHIRQHIPRPRLLHPLDKLPNEIYLDLAIFREGEEGRGGVLVVGGESAGALNETGKGNGLGRFCRVPAGRCWSVGLASASAPENWRTDIEDGTVVYCGYYSIRGYSASCSQVTTRSCG